MCAVGMIVQGRKGNSGGQDHLTQQSQRADAEVAEVIWTAPALDELEEIAEYIALDKPGAASSLVKAIFSTVERLELFPESGHVPPELPDSIYRELHVRPCRIFYRNDGGVDLILHVMRSEEHTSELQSRGHL